MNYIGSKFKLSSFLQTNIEAALKARVKPHKMQILNGLSKLQWWGTIKPKNKFVQFLKNIADTLLKAKNTNALSQIPNESKSKIPRQNICIFWGSKPILRNFATMRKMLKTRFYYLHLHILLRGNGIWLRKIKGYKDIHHHSKEQKWRCALDNLHWRNFRKPS